MADLLDRSVKTERDLGDLLSAPVLVIPRAPLAARAGLKPMASNERYRPRGSSKRSHRRPRPPSRPGSRSPALASILSPGSAAFEPFRVLRTKLRTLGRRAARSAASACVSATAQEGTSAVALGLAAALAQERRAAASCSWRRGCRPPRSSAGWAC